MNLVNKEVKQTIVQFTSEKNVSLKLNTQHSIDAFLIVISIKLIKIHANHLKWI